MPASFLYFDMGNVLLRFDHRRSARQMASVAGVGEDVIWQIVFVEGLELRHESGQASDEEFYETICRRTGTRPDRQRLLHAASDIFEINAPIVPIVAQLFYAGYRMGVLSNTSPPHWKHVSSGRFGILPGGFEVLALSFEIGAIKPDAKLFERAAELAGVVPGEIFYVDDVAENVLAARAVGFDAVQYTSAAALAADLRRRGVGFNY